MSLGLAGLATVKVGQQLVKVSRCIVRECRLRRRGGTSTAQILRGLLAGLWYRGVRCHSRARGLMTQTPKWVQSPGPSLVLFVFNLIRWRKK